MGGYVFQIFHFAPAKPLMALSSPEPKPLPAAAGWIYFKQEDDDAGGPHWSRPTRQHYILLSPSGSLEYFDESENGTHLRAPVGSLNLVRAQITPLGSSVTGGTAALQVKLSEGHVVHIETADDVERDRWCFELNLAGLRAASSELQTAAASPAPNSPYAKAVSPAPPPPPAATTGGSGIEPASVADTRPCASTAFALGSGSFRTQEQQQTGKGLLEAPGTAPRRKAVLVWADESKYTQDDNEADERPQPARLPAPARLPPPTPRPTPLSVSASSPAMVRSKPLAEQTAGSRNARVRRCHQSS